MCGAATQQPLPVRDSLGERELTGLVGPDQGRVGGDPAAVVDRCRARRVVDARGPDHQSFLHGRIVADWRIRLERRSRARRPTDTEEDTQSGCLREIRTEKVERETGFEPATFCLGSRHSAS